MSQGEGESEKSVLRHAKHEWMVSTSPVALCLVACLLVCSCVLLLASSCLKRTGANPFTETPLKGLNSTQGSDAANLIRVCVRDSDHTMLRQASVNV